MFNSDAANFHILLLPSHTFVYKEDPYLDAALNNAQITRLYTGLQAVKNEADALARDRIKLAEELLATYDDLYYLTSKAVRPDLTRTKAKSETKHFRQNLASYQKAVTAKADNAIALADAVRCKLDSYVTAVALRAAAQKETYGSKKSESQDRETQSKANKTEVVESVKEVNKAFIALGGSLGTDFETSFIKNLSVISASASKENLKALFEKEPKEFDVLGQRIKALNITLQELRQRGRRIPESVSKDLEDAAMGMSIPAPGDIKKSVDAIAKVATDVPSSLGIGDRGATALNQLVQSTTLLCSQIDRLQDPADPMRKAL